MSSLTLGGLATNILTAIKTRLDNAVDSHSSFTHEVRSSLAPKLGIVPSSRRYRKVYVPVCHCRSQILRASHSVIPQRFFSTGLRLSRKPDHRLVARHMIASFPAAGMKFPSNLRNYRAVSFHYIMRTCQLVAAYCHDAHRLRSSTAAGLISVIL